MRETDERQDLELERYLLGDLPDEQIQRIDGRLLEQPDLFSRVETIEDDLVDRYVRDELSGEDRRRFEERLLPSDRIRRRVAFARSLHRLAEERSRDQSGRAPLRRPGGRRSRRSGGRAEPAGRCRRGSPGPPAWSQ